MLAATAVSGSCLVTVQVCIPAAQQTKLAYTHHTCGSNSLPARPTLHCVPAGARRLPGHRHVADLVSLGAAGRWLACAQVASSGKGGGRWAQGMQQSDSQAGQKREYICERSPYRATVPWPRAHLAPKLGSCRGHLPLQRRSLAPLHAAAAQWQSLLQLPRDRHRSCQSRGALSAVEIPHCGCGQANHTAMVRCRGGNWVTPMLSLGLLTCTFMPPSSSPACPDPASRDSSGGSRGGGFGGGIGAPPLACYSCRVDKLLCRPFAGCREAARSSRTGSDPAHMGIRDGCVSEQPGCQHLVKNGGCRLRCVQDKRTTFHPMILAAE